MGSRFPPTKQGASSLSRARMGHDFLQIIPQRFRAQIFTDTPGQCTYVALKRVVAQPSRVVKNVATGVLGGWVENSGDDDFKIE
jgi:hypothetical protein